MASLKDLAAACGVSIATVSKALNDQPDVSEKTKERIRKAAKEMGYSPNSAAKMLKTNESRNIGVLFADEARSGLTHDYFNHVLDSFRREIERFDYDLTLLNCGQGRKGGMTYLERARYRGFDGIIIACIDFNDPEVLELVRSGIPVVTIDYIFNNTLAVISDNIAGMEDLVDYVTSKGHKKIAYIHGADSAVTQARVSSFCLGMEKRGLEVPDEYMKEAAYRNTTQTFNRTLELLDLPDPPTCIFFPDDFAAHGGVNAIRSRGLRIPEDISVAGYDGTAMARLMEPALTTLHQDTERMGKAAARKLISQIRSPRTTLMQPVTIRGELVKGHSVRDLTAEGPGK